MQKQVGYAKDDTCELCLGDLTYTLVQILGGKEDFWDQRRQEGKKREHSKATRGYKAIFFIKENQTVQALKKQQITLFPPTFFLLFHRREMLA